MDRISILGTSGSGKTTLARRLSAAFDVPHLELDAVFHQPGWTGLPDLEFQAVVREFCAADRWVVCGKYSQVRELVLARADTVVCLDHGRLRQTVRVAWRTARRAVRREELWNGNRESWRALAVWRDPQESIVRWTWDNVPAARRLFDEVEQRFAADPAVEVVRLRGWREMDAWLSPPAPRPSGPGAP